MSHVLSWLLSHVLCFTFHVSSLMPHVPCLTFDIGGMRHAWDMRHEDLRHEAWKNMRHETRDTRPLVFCLLYHASCLMTHVSCLLSSEIWDMTPPSSMGGGGWWQETWGMKTWAMSHQVRDMKIGAMKKHDARDTRLETRAIRHETRGMRHELRDASPPPWDMVCTKRVDSEGGYSWRYESMFDLLHVDRPVSILCLYLCTNLFLPPPLPHLPPPDSFFFLPVLYILSSWEGGGGEGGGD